MTLFVLLSYNRVSTEFQRSLDNAVEFLRQLVTFKQWNCVYQVL